MAAEPRRNREQGEGLKQTMLWWRNRRETTKEDCWELRLQRAIVVDDYGERVAPRKHCTSWGDLHAPSPREARRTWM